MLCATVQLTPAFRQLERNLATIVAHASSIEASVIVFPELATCGYFFRTPEECRPYALPADAVEFQALADIAIDQKKNIVVGFAERAGDALYNSSMLVTSDGARHIYRKTHLFYREKDVFSPGNTGFFTTPLPDLDCSVGMMICYDWRFPEAARSLALQGVDLIVCPSNLVTNIWRMAMPVRALENMVYLAIANRGGMEENDGERVVFNGDSVLYAYNGQALASASGTDDIILIADIDPSQTRNKSFNSYNDIFADRRPELYAL